MKYVFLFYGTTASQKQWEETPQEVRNAQYDHVVRWLSDNKDKLGANNRLQGPHTATSVVFDSKGNSTLRDGPFIEGNEVIGGYVEVNVADLDEAIRLAKAWPANGVVEIRPVMEMMGQ